MTLFAVSRLRNKRTTNLKQTSYTKVDEFLRDDDFIRYVLDACTDKASYWESYLNAAPNIRTAYLKAYHILNHLDSCDFLSNEEMTRLKQRIMRSVHLNVN